MREVDNTITSQSRMVWIAFKSGASVGTMYEWRVAIALLNPLVKVDCNRLSGTVVQSGK